MGNQIDQGGEIERFSRFQSRINTCIMEVKILLYAPSVMAKVVYRQLHRQQPTEMYCKLFNGFLSLIQRADETLVPKVIAETFQS